MNGNLTAKLSKATLKYIETENQLLLKDLLKFKEQNL